MTPELWREVEARFREVLALSGPDRPAYLKALRRSSPVAATELERLLEHDRAASVDWRGVDLIPASEPAETAPAGPLMVTLRVVDGPHAGRSFTYRGHDTFVVGRSRRSTFRLPAADMTLSRFQFLIEINPPACRLVDMASTNGTRLNGRRIEVADLYDGDVVRGGRTSFAVSIECDGSSVVASPNRDVSASVASVGKELAHGLPELPDYRLERFLGEGGMGAVYLGRDSQGLEVAVKVVSPASVGTPNAIARFLREASILRHLEHPAIVGYRAVGRTGDRFYFAMEYVPGVDARTVVKANGPMPISDAVRVIVPILGALAYAHERGFIHRDVKPSNVLIFKEGGAVSSKLADFGLARLYQDSPLSGLTMTGCAGGTVGFMPPEQITDLRAARPYSDQYSAAATFYYLLTGRTIHDFPTTTQGQLLKILNEDVVPIRSRRPEIPEALADIIQRALSRKPSARFADVGEFRGLLASF